MKYQNNMFFIVLGILLASLPGCFSKPVKQEGLVVINVLDKELYDDCHIKGSINIPFDMVEHAAKDIDKQAEIVLYCSNYQCSTSEYAARKLRNLGFKQVAVYQGGTAEWFQAGLPVEGACEHAYLKKPTRPIAEESTPEIPVITVQQLIQKMGLQPAA